MGSSETERLLEVVSPLAEGSGCWGLLRRGGAPLLALPSEREAALLALALYQPQSRLARLLVGGLKSATRLGVHRWVLPLLRGTAAGPQQAAPASRTGVLFGSPDHRIQRAVVIRPGPSGWEVCKVAFGEEGSAMLAREAEVMGELAERVCGVPEVLGLEAFDGGRVLRMAHVQGEAVVRGGLGEVLQLLDAWWAGEANVPITSLSDWTSVSESLGEVPGGEDVVDRLSNRRLRPCVRHGDLARWNLRRQPDGALAVLDWEWGVSRGMPGIDLVHFVCQDLSLVDKLAPAEAVSETCRILGQEGAARYLKSAGWDGDPIEVVVAYLAFKQGAGHQDNEEILGIAVKEWTK